MSIYQHTNSSSTQWTVVHNKAFQRAIVMLPENIPNRWEKMTHHVPGNWSLEDLKQRYEKLEHDVLMIVFGEVEFLELLNKVEPVKVHQGTLAVPDDKKKGTLWTAEEHRLFVRGLEKCGNGDWKGIATKFVVSRNPSQVASHAQKYFLRQNTTKDDRKRKSIHDITTRESDQTSVSLPRFNKKKHYSAPHLDDHTPPT
ncbi:hypothetical protein TanjilG_19289 [Lupinus angustifolius]|uniref:HTH myb-type domain-containing protein n=1 Tax=Lupinus angustifolius TaxID=3871 RepID=A0A1J7HYV1_LUPAN|nr:PREDICTED: transcription factor DIVARICATA-like [Lupinus angustifolius]OIW18057.1 hypothetical protein TanjilG_19289 [Lupinus angustifolius]